jgi:hypothetical protein
MLLNFFGALGQTSIPDTSQRESKMDESKERDPILEGLLYGRKVSQTELANAIKRQQEKKQKG